MKRVRKQVKDKVYDNGQERSDTTEERREYKTQLTA